MSKNSNNKGNLKTGRPIIKLKFNNTEKIMITISIAVTLLMWAYVLLNVKHMPMTIPTHFTMSGKPNSWGSRNTIFIMPIICSIVIGLLIFISRFPRFFNYPIKITEKNAERQYRNSGQLMLALAIELPLVFLYIEYKIVQSALGLSLGLGNYFFTIFIVIIFGTIIFFTRRMRKLG